MNVFVDGGGNRKGNCYYGIAFYRGEDLVWKIGNDLNDCRTNNEAEYEALYMALLALRLNSDLLDTDDITIYMDSQLIVRQVLGQYEVKAYNLAWRALLVKRYLEELRSNINPRKVWLKHIPREMNKEADKTGRQSLMLSEDWDEMSAIEKGRYDLISE